MPFYHNYLYACFTVLVARGISEMGFQVSQDEAIIFIRVELGDKGQEGQLLALKYETDQEMLLKSLLSDGNSKACAV